MRTRSLAFVTLFTAFVILLSCSTTNDLVQTKMSVPASYGNVQPDSASIASSPWRIFYNDSALHRVISEALTHNRDLQVAFSEATLAGNNYRLTSQNYLPFADLQIGNRLTRYGEYTMDGVGNDDTNRSDGVPPDKKIPNPYREWFSGIAFGWEADIWGKLSSKRKAAMARYLASREVYQFLITQLVSDIAVNYYAMAGLDQEKKVLERNLQLQELAVELVKIQKAGGKVNQLAVDQFEAQVLNLKARIAEVDQRILETQTKLNSLSGRFPETIARDSLFDDDTLSLPVLGKPHELLKNRPDILAAEYALSASKFDIGAARAAFYPSLTIGGSAGFAAFNLSKWFLMPGSAVYNVATGLSAPLFQRKQIQTLYESAKVKQRVALVQYERAVIGSFNEVYIMHNNFENLSRQIKIKNSEADVLRRAFNNSNDLFSVGYASYLEVITAQRRMLEVELELIRLKTQKLQSRALLYRALGGGWK